MGVQNELEGQNFLRVVNNEILYMPETQQLPFSPRTIVEPRLAAIL